MAHEELKKQYEEDCKNFERPWELWSYRKSPHSPLNRCSPGFTFCHYLEYIRKEPPFIPEYFSGLNWRNAEKLIGKVVEYSDDPDSIGWESGVLKGLDLRGGRRFEIKSDNYYEYIRTTPQTYTHPTITIEVNGKEYKLPRPEVEAPEGGTKIYIVSLTGRVEEYKWDGSQYAILKQGKIHLTEDRAQAWADWWRDTVVAEVNK